MTELTREMVGPSVYFRSWKPKPADLRKESKAWLKSQLHPQGHSRKLSDRDIHSIRTSCAKVIDIAKQFKISVSYASKIRHGRCLRSAAYYRELARKL